MGNRDSSASEKPAVLITGASSGIGAAAADLLVRRGFDVFGTSRRPDHAAAARPDVRWIAMDVRDEASVQEGVARVEQLAGRLDGLVCNAGFGIFGSVEEVTDAAARDQFETNYFGVLRTLRAVIPGMRTARRGRIVGVGSLGGRAPIPFQSHYSATKAAIEATWLALHNELHPFGVSVSLIEPGDIDTPFNEHMDWGRFDGSPYAGRIRRSAQVIRESLPRAPGPEIVAAAIHRALVSPRPRIRYAVGPDSWNVPFGRRFLPDRLFLRLVRKHFDV